MAMEGGVSCANVCVHFCRVPALPWDFDQGGGSILQNRYPAILSWGPELRVPGGTDLVGTSLSATPSQPADLHPMMTAALISNKPEFVRLFLENGVRLKEFVTWDTLLCLYENLEPSCLFHSKLQKVLAEEHERLTYAPATPRLHMHHVAQVLRELLGDSTQLLYPRPRYTDRPRLSLPMPHIKLNVSAGNVDASDVAAGVSGAGACWRWTMSGSLVDGLCILSWVV